METTPQLRRQQLFQLTCAALSGFSANRTICGCEVGWKDDDVARLAVELAVATLKALERA